MINYFAYIVSICAFILSSLLVLNISLLLSILLGVMALATYLDLSKFIKINQYRGQTIMKPLKMIAYGSLSCVLTFGLVSAMLMKNQGFSIFLGALLVLSLIQMFMLRKG